jgi:hypothetical protein
VPSGDQTGAAGPSPITVRASKRATGLADPRSARTIAGSRCEKPSRRVPSGDQVAQLNPGMLLSVLPVGVAITVAAAVP